MSTGSGTRVAIVTGGSRGIGRATVRRLAAHGYSIMVGYAANADEADAAVAEATALGAKATAFKADVGDETAVEAMFVEAESQFGGIDVVVHAPAIAHLATIVETDLAELDAMYRTNFRGSFVVAQQAGRRVRRGGAIILFSSAAIKASAPNWGGYVATKGAVEAMTMTLARELRGRDVSVNTIAPGATATDALVGTMTEAEIAALTAASPLERLGQPSDIAEFAAFLASPEGHWINGQVVGANGGIA